MFVYLHKDLYVICANFCMAIVQYSPFACDCIVIIMLCTQCAFLFIMYFQLLYKQ